MAFTPDSANLATVYGGPNRIIMANWGNYRTHGFYNVLDFGATGDGSHDDTSAFQAAIDAAVALKGTLVIPAPTSAWIISDELLIADPSSTQTFMNIEANGRITWAGGNNKSIFHSKGWKNSYVRGGRILVNNASGIKAWHIDDPTGYTSSSSVSFYDSLLSITGTSANCYGYYCGDPVAGQDVSLLNWVNCKIDAVDNSLGNVGWFAAHSNCLGFTWIAGGGTKLGKMVQMNSSPLGGGAHTWTGAVAGYNLVDFEFAANGSSSFNIIGGRFENGNRFWSDIGYPASGVTTATLVRVDGPTIMAYDPSDDILFAISAPGYYDLSPYIFNSGGSNYTADMIHLAGGAGGYGRLKLGGVLQAADPCYTVDSGHWTVDRTAVIKSSAGAATGLFT